MFKIFLKVSRTTKVVPITKATKSEKMKKSHTPTPKSFVFLKNQFLPHFLNLPTFLNLIFMLLSNFELFIELEKACL